MPCATGGNLSEGPPEKYRPSTGTMPCERRAEGVRPSLIGAGSRVPHLRHLLPEMRRSAATSRWDCALFPTSYRNARVALRLLYRRCTPAPRRNSVIRRGNPDEAREAYSVLILSGQLVE